MNRAPWLPRLGGPEESEHVLSKTEAGFCKKLENVRRWTALGLLRAQKDTVRECLSRLEWHEGGVGTETSPGQSLRMLKVGAARSEAGGITGTGYGLYPEGDGKASHGAGEPDPAQELPLPWPKQPTTSFRGEGDSRHSSTAPSSLPLLSSHSMCLA